MQRKRSYEETKAEVEALSIEEVRATPAWKKIQQALELTEALRKSIRDKLIGRYPRATEEELRKRFGIVWLGPELAKQAFGWEVNGDDSDLMVV